jgi:hypothetical protein
MLFMNLGVSHGLSKVPPVAFQGKLMYLYKLFCEKITEIEMGT